MNPRLKFQHAGREWHVELREDGGHPRVDFWKGVDWCGQWQWLGSDFGKRLQRGYHSRQVKPEVLAAAAERLRRTP